MNGPPFEGGILSRLRQNETLRRISGGRPELIIFGAPVAAAIIVIAVVVIALSGGGGKSNTQASAKTPSAPSATPAATPTGENAGLKTPIAISPGSVLQMSDLAARGSGEPGRGQFTGTRLVIPKIGVAASFSFKPVGTDGQMPNPNGPEDVAYYDFSQWPGLGGLPNKGGNVVIAGHVDYIRYGPAVFWRLHELEIGDTIDVEMADGSMASYAVEFNKVLEVSDADWTAIVAATHDESITLITCGGQFEAGHYNNRQIVWGRRV